MNNAAVTSKRLDGYVQDKASQLVVESIEMQEGKLILDLCAAPGGKSTGLAGRGFEVVASDLNFKRARLIKENADKLDLEIPVVNSDALRPPFRSSVADRVLIDAPCSGLGSLRRRADARWQIDSEAPLRLSKIQIGLIEAGLELVKPGGFLTYSVCTLTKEEGERVLSHVSKSDAVVVENPNLSSSEMWEKQGDISYLWPDETDGMLMFELQKKL